jgi:SAM-dependent methyltransferase
MRKLDRFLQNWRARKARPWIAHGARVLDIGCHQGEFLRSLADSIGPSVGIDPLAIPESGPHYQLLAEAVREPLPFPDGSFDVIVMLATLEHIRDKEMLGRECYRLLRPNGQIIITVPSLLVDKLVALLCNLRLADGMSLDEHHGYDPRTTPEVFGRNGFVLEHVSRFQLGLNYLFVLRKPLPVVVEGMAGARDSFKSGAAIARAWPGGLSAPALDPSGVGR